MAIKRLTTLKQREAIKKINESFLNGLTDEQIENYINNNVTDLVSAKQVLIKMAKIIVYIAKKQGLIK